MFPCYNPVLGRHACPASSLRGCYHVGYLSCLSATAWPIPTEDSARGVDVWYDYAVLECNDMQLGMRFFEEKKLTSVKFVDALEPALDFTPQWIEIEWRRKAMVDAATFAPKKKKKNGFCRAREGYAR